MTTLLWILAGCLGTLALTALGRALQLEQRAVGRALLTRARLEGGVFRARDGDLVVTVRLLDTHPELWLISRARGGLCNAMDLPTRRAEVVAGSWWVRR